MAHNIYDPAPNTVREITEEEYLAIKASKQRVLPAPTTYAEFLMHCQVMQRRYIAEEQTKIRKMWKAWDAYKAKAHKLNLHPLSPAELSARESELARMQATVTETHGDTASNRALWDARSRETE